MNKQNLLNISPIPLRIVAGIRFMIHGIPKLIDDPNTQFFQ